LSPSQRRRDDQADSLTLEMHRTGRFPPRTSVGVDGLAVAYQGLRVPEDVLALEVRHVRPNTLLIEQRNIDGKIVGARRSAASTGAPPWRLHDTKIDARA
jgi:hypothetical protein